MGQCEQCKNCGEGAACSNCPTDTSPRDVAVAALVTACRDGSLTESIDAAALLLDYELRTIGC